MATKSTIEMGETKKAEPKKKEASGGHGDAYSGAISSRAIQKKKARQVASDTARGIGEDKRTGCQKKTDSTGLDWGKSTLYISSRDNPLFYLVVEQTLELQTSNQ